jgi:hypothetical protein
MEEEYDMRWFRWWHEGIRDGKLLRLTAAQRWIWLAILTIASESPKRGSLYESPELPSDVRDVARMATEDVSLVRETIEAMLNKPFNMLTVDENGAWVVVNWEKYQPNSDDVTARTKAHKERKRNVPRNAQTTFSDTESDTDSEADTDKKHIKANYDVEFEELWSIYPHPPRDEKPRAKTNYTTLRKTGESYDKLKVTVMRYEVDRRGKEREYHTKMANFFGKKGTWMSYVDDEPTSLSQPEQPVPASPPGGLTSMGLDFIQRLEQMGSRSGQS